MIKETTTGAIKTCLTCGERLLKGRDCKCSETLVKELELKNMAFEGGSFENVFDMVSPEHIAEN